MLVQGPGWGPSGLYLERTLGPLLADWSPHFFAARNTPGGPEIGGAESQATDQLVDDLEGERARLGCDRVIVVGHSHGAFVAMGYAVRYPRRVAALVLLGPSIVAPASTPGSREILEGFRGDAARTGAVEWWERHGGTRRDVADDREFARHLRASAPLNFYNLNALARCVGVR